MKDLYSVHATKKDFWKYYEEVSDAYLKIFSRLGFKVVITEAAGGVFTKNLTREFQVIAPVGEDTVYVCNKCQAGFNKEIFKGQAGDKCLKCGKGTVEENRAIEVGNIFPFDTYYSEKMGVYFTDKLGVKKPVWFGSYGIGITRLLGAIVEVYHDEKGISWPKIVAPYSVHLIGLENNKEVKETSEKLYQNLWKEGIEVLYDDRVDKTAGEKFVDADLIGIPLRVVVSERTLAQNSVELKERDKKETELVATAKFMTRIKILLK